MSELYVRPLNSAAYSQYIQYGPPKLSNLAPLAAVFFLFSCNLSWLGKSMPVLNYRKAVKGAKKLVIRGDRWSRLYVSNTHLSTNS